MTLDCTHSCIHTNIVLHKSPQYTHSHRGWSLLNCWEGNIWGGKLQVLTVLVDGTVPGVLFLVTWQWIHACSHITHETVEFVDVNSSYIHRTVFLTLEMSVGADVWGSVSPMVCFAKILVNCCSTCAALFIMFVQLYSFLIISKIFVAILIFIDGLISLRVDSEEFHHTRVTLSFLLGYRTNSNDNVFGWVISLAIH